MQFKFGKILVEEKKGCTVKGLHLAVGCLILFSDVTRSFTANALRVQMYVLFALEMLIFSISQQGSP